MRVTFTKNLGQIDAQNLGLDYLKCIHGACVEVEDSVGGVLIKRGLACASPVVIAVAPAPAISVPKPPEIKADTSKPSVKAKPLNKES